LVQDDFRPGLEGVVAFHTEIAEPTGTAERCAFGPGLPPAEPFPLPVHTGDVRVDVQAAPAMLAPIWGYTPLLDSSNETAREQLARASAMALCGDDDHPGLRVGEQRQIGGERQAAADHHGERIGDHRGPPSTVAIMLSTT